MRGDYGVMGEPLGMAPIVEIGGGRLGLNERWITEGSGTELNMVRCIAPGVEASAEAWRLFR